MATCSQYQLHALDGYNTLGRKTIPTNMSLEICSPCFAQKKLIWNLFQFYCYDTSPEDDEDVEETGFYSLSQDYFAQYWTAPNWSAHLLRWEGAIAGFALIETSDALPGGMELADLFIMKRFRRNGIGRQVVRHFMSSRTVPWTVVVYDEAVEAKAFWNSIFQDSLFTPSRQVPDPDYRKVTTHVLEPTIAA